MLFWRTSLSCAAIWIIAGNIGHAQQTTAGLQHLVEMSARRLVIAEQVALAKWDQRVPVEDASREARVIAHAVEDGRKQGVDEASITRFFRAQIEANKLVQYSLLAEWSRTGAAPHHAPVDLANAVRPELDRLDAALMTALAETAAVRASGSCRVDTAKAVGTYLATPTNRLNVAQAVALDRAMGGSCP